MLPTVRGTDQPANEKRANKETNRQATQPLLPALTNFRAINQEAYIKELEKVDWKKTLDVPNDKLAQSYVDEMCNAVLRVNVPRFRNSRNKKAQEKLKALVARRTELHKQNEHPSVTNETQKYKT